MRFIIVDCETTGIDETDEPIAIGALVCALDSNGEGSVVESWYGEQEPSVPISAAAEMTHGISEIELKGKSFDIQGLSATLNKAHLIISHNARFDARMLGKVFPDIISRSWRCSLRQMNLPEFKGQNLDAICAHYAIDRDRPHNALSDCKVLFAALNRRPGKTLRSKTHFTRLIEMPNWPVFLRKEPFLALDSSDNILFSFINEPVLLECTVGTSIRLWTNPNVDFIVGYARINGYCGSQGEAFRFNKKDNPKVAGSIHRQTLYEIASFDESGILITPARA